MIDVETMRAGCRDLPMRHLAKIGQTRHQHHRGLADAKEYPLGGGIGDAPARPSRQIDPYMSAIAQAVERKGWRFSVGADAGCNSKTRSSDDDGTVRAPAGPVRGPCFQRVGIEQR